MTQEETLEYNKMCAKFLGWKETSEEFKIAWVGCKTKERLEKINKDCIPILEKDGDIRFPDFSGFTEDWNWIMEVIEKIYSLSIYYDKYKPLNSSQFTNGGIELTTNKEAVVEAINQFLIWYNYHDFFYLN